MELINAINYWAAAIGMRQVFGDEAADEAWGNEVGDSIASVLIEPQGARPRNVPLLTKYYLNAE